MRIANVIPGGEIALYESTDGGIRLDVRLEQETVWLTQTHMAELFGRERSVITKHINNVFAEGELPKESNVQNLHIASSDKPVAFYSLDTIISIGYRVKSRRGTQFRIWATRVLREHLVRGYTVNARRLKELKQAVRLIASRPKKLHCLANTVLDMCSGNGRVAMAMLQINAIPDSTLRYRRRSNPLRARAVLVGARWVSEPADFGHG